MFDGSDIDANDYEGSPRARMEEGLEQKYDADD